MGARGPAPKPTALRMLHGDQPKRINKNEPKPLEVPIIRPDWLSPAATAEWERLAPHLVAMGTMKATDEAMLAAYCEAYGRWRTLTKLANGTPPSFKRVTHKPDGTEEIHFARNQIWSQVRDATDQLRVLAREFGLTPSARAGLRVEVVDGRSSGARLLTGNT